MSALAAGPLAGNSSSAHDCLICLRCARIPPIRSDFRFSRRRRISSRVLIRSVQEQRLSVTEGPKEEEKEVELVNGYSWNGNGSVPGLEVAERSANGNLDAYLKANGADNGSLVKYAGGSEAAVEEMDGATAEKKRKKRVEEIGKEDAWFKNPQEKQVRRVNGFLISLPFAIRILFTME